MSWKGRLLLTNLLKRWGTCSLCCSQHRLQANSQRSKYCFTWLPTLCFFLLFILSLSLSVSPTASHPRAPLQSLHVLQILRNIHLKLVEQAALHLIPAFSVWWPFLQTLQSESVLSAAVGLSLNINISTDLSQLLMVDFWSAERVMPSYYQELWRRSALMCESDCRLTEPHSQPKWTAPWWGKSVEEV